MKGATLNLLEILLQNYAVFNSLPNHDTDCAAKGLRDSYHQLKDSKKGCKIASLNVNGIRGAS